MQDIFIDEEFESLLPVLDAETFALLEESLLQNGCLHPIVLWGNVIVDGHNRFKICVEHGIPFNTVSKDFASREEALIWIISLQVARRNLSPIQLSHFRGLHYRADRRIQGTSNQYVQESEKAQNGLFQKNQSTAQRLAGQYNVSRNTIKRDSRLSEAIEAIGETSPEAKRRILSGEVRVNKNVLESLPSMSSEEIAEIAASIEDGSYERKRSGSPGGDDGRSGADGRPFLPDFGFPDGRGRPSVPDEGNGDSALMRPFEAAIARITEELMSELRLQAGGGDSAELKSALRSYINMLEDLYGRI